uniref:olfactory receptor 6F1-like n=1 Tax=Euleptes europaea TaxID=460621 RepID=UPI0025405339|nr:olfactory receptor 6F1-like [Euleptes europaea]XP_056722738.1 olfactory receptor 6F1-like [Euleptes europaea]
MPQNDTIGFLFCFSSSFPSFMFSGGNILRSPNQTMVTEFILLGFGNLHGLTIFTFMIFLTIYIITIVGNLMIIVTVWMDHSLHNPMYFFLGNLSFLELWYTTSVVPKMLKTFLNGHETISFSACLLQFYVFGSLAVVECFLLAAMSYDRYMAICHPLHYTRSMNFKVCLLFVIGSWVSGFLSLVVTMPMVSMLPFCDSNEIDHFFCDLAPIVKLACGDTQKVRIPAFIIASLVSFSPFLLTVLSYYKIISTILKISSTKGKQKAFSTCFSHLTVVTVFYGTLMVVYAGPTSTQWPNLRKVFSVLYIVGTPMVNPIIYSLRNKEVQNALRKLLNRNAILVHSK